MDVPHVGAGSAGYQPIAPEAAQAPGRSPASTPATRPTGPTIPPELLSDDRLKGELARLGLPPTPAHMTAARALVLQGQALDAKTLGDLEHTLAGLPLHDLAAAKAVAYLLSQKLPVTPQTMSLAMGRHDAADPLGTRLAGLLDQVMDNLMDTGQDLAGSGFKDQLLSALKTMTLPEGDRQAMQESLKRLIKLMGSPEADLAKLLQHEFDDEITADAKSRLVSLLEGAVDQTPDEPELQQLRDEIRFNQLASTGHDPAEPPPVTIPLAWQGGSGEIRVYERPEGGQKRPGEGPGSTRVVMALNTDQLKAVQIDMLLARKQVNCHIVVQDPELAAFLTPYLSELKSAIMEAGIGVNALDVRSEKRGTGPLGKAPDVPAKGVDFYG